MKTTSHFVGIPFHPEPFIDIFLGIKNILGEDVASILEFQNPLSIHATIFYLGEKLAKTDRDVLRQFIKDQEKTVPIFSLGPLAYFGDIKNPKIGYISFSESKDLTDLNEQMGEKFHQYKNIPDNNHDEYIPHITLFKIKDWGKFLKKEEEIQKLITSELEKIQSLKLTEEVRLYAVNSSFNPEIQIPIIL